MKILVFTEGTIFSHRDWLALSRDEIVRRVKEGERPDYSGTVPIGGAARKLRAWNQDGVEIVYLTSRREPAQVEEVRKILRRYGFPMGEVFFRQAGEEYKDVAERVMPDMIVEDDCESIGGELEMAYPHINPDAKARIKSIVVEEFGGLDHLPDDVGSLFR